ncbi:DUF2062 domain-containing protein [Poseidonibacter lekithochrous]|uniref:DUF2062 domain-containing protein n=1 Tax=Poseidonibacter lekithochrous TaxID=1904463 RepID=UPI0008FCBC79|nr:DUF2062 domain-containing protein [Poseidonibacter lekithochrous]QKJ23684.1 DUF2062 domain-containing membrane protein [Poseidonibacter lekithochrous]
MPKKILQKILPSHKKIKEQKYLKIFGQALYKREIWSLHRKRVLGAVFLGVFVSCLPIPLQMVLVTFLAIIFNVNLPISFALLFINNPITIPFIFYIEYEIGAYILNASNSITFDLDSMYENLGDIAIYLYLGSIILGLVLASISTVITNISWIYYVRKKRKS